MAEETKTEQRDVRVAWLSGDRAERRKLLERIRGKLGEHEEVRFGGDATFDEVERAVLAGDCFSQKRMVVLDAMPMYPGPRASFTAEMKRLMDRVPPDCLLVFNGMDPGDEKGLSGHASKIGKTFQYDTHVEAGEAAQVVSRHVASLGKSIDAGLASKLVSLMPAVARERRQLYGIEHLRLTADKLAALSDRRAEVSEEDVLLCTPDLSQTTSWLFYDAVDDKDFDRAYALLQKLLVAEGDRSEGCRLTLHGMVWRYRLMMVLAEGLRKGKSSDAAKAAGEVVRITQQASGLKMRLRCDGPLYSDAVIAKMLSSNSPLAKYSPKRLAATFEAAGRGLEATRYTSSVSTLLFVVESVLMTACERHDDTSRSRHHWFFEEFAAE